MAHQAFDCSIPCADARVNLAVMIFRHLIPLGIDQVAFLGKPPLSKRNWPKPESETFFLLSLSARNLQQGRALFSCQRGQIRVSGAISAFSNPSPQFQRRAFSCWHNSESGGCHEISNGPVRPWSNPTI
ncbi:hypothetical protein LZ31DRAFT_198557 [Colletotrichum somersetense]|nr:hypothetical protein LZ31DRAFT_198557 [Colletotrichum somersetense]